MQSHLSKIRSLGGEVIGISVDTPEQNKQLIETAKLEFPILSDTSGDAMDAYGLRHPGASMYGGDVARPAVFVIDRTGQIAWRELTDNWRIRVRGETIVEQLQQLD